MPATPPDIAAMDLSPAAVSRLLRERDELLLLHEALAEVERARTLEQRLRILVHAIQRVGYGRVDSVDHYTMPSNASVVAWVSNSAFLDSNEVIVPVRSVDGTTVATLILGNADQPGPPTLARARTVELFAQQVASIIENARLYEQSVRERVRGEAVAAIARGVSGSLRLDDVMQMSLGHAVALLRSEGAGFGLLRDDQIVVVAGIGSAVCLIGAPLPLNGSVAGRTLRERKTIITNDATDPDVYTPTRTAAGIERAIFAPLYSSEGPIGVLSVINRATPFTEDDAEVLQRLADQVAVAIANARLYEEAKEAADRYRQLSEDERRARDAAALSEARYARLVESASDAIFTVDAGGRLSAVNRSLERASGKERTALLGLPLVELLDVRDRDTAWRALLESLGGVRRRLELRYPSLDGETRHCSLTLTPLIEGTTVTGALGVVRDVTDEKRLAEQLMQQEKLAAVGQLVSGVAHELNNPLASVMAFSQLLLASPPGAPQNRQAVETINQEARRAAKIVANLLTFARQHQPERTLTDLNRVVDDTLELRRYAMRTANVTVETHLDASLPITWADPFQLQQVVLNLLTNAEQAMDAWTGERRIVVTTARQGAELVVRIADSGPGIAPEHLGRVFDPFFTTKGVGEGTGLGLSISDGIVREHGGRIRIESAPGAGTTFHIELPWVAPPASASAAAAVRSAPVKRARRLLVVDDEPAIRQAIALYFRSLGHVVDLAGNGRDALRLGADNHYDAVLLDFRLPDISGAEVFAGLKAMPLAPDRVVFVTGDTQSESARRVLEATGCARVSKPFLLDQLASVVLAEREPGALSLHDDQGPGT